MCSQGYYHSSPRPLRMRVESQPSAVWTLQANKREYATFLATRPKQFEADAIKMLLLQLKRVEDAAALVKSDPPTGWGLHIVHLGHAGMVAEIGAAKAAGARFEREVFTSTGAEVKCVFC